MRSHDVLSATGKGERVCMPIYTAKLPQVPDTPNDSEKSPHHDKEDWRLWVVFFRAAFGFVSPTWGVKQYKSDAQTLEKNGVVRKKK